ncbi:MAG: T6SS amidase immunity protein Tai4 family protein [Xanthobacteraceae bacterium]
MLEYALSATIRGFAMGAKSSVFVAAIFLVMPSIVDAEDTGIRVKYSAAEYLKNFALSVCISDGYKSDEVVKDSLHAAGGYLELGGFPIEAYDEAAALGKTFLAKNYESMQGGQITLMKCIDFFHSKELDQLIKKYSKK